MVLIHEDTGTYDDERQYTAWELCGDHWWVHRDYRARVKGGRVDWEIANNFRGALVRLQRLVPGRQGIRVMTRYVDPDTPMVLVKTQWTDTSP